MNELTEHYAIPKPNPANNVGDDVVPLQQAFDILDGAVYSLALLVASKAAADHSHAIAGITGLADALAGKMAAGRTFTLAEMTDVVGADDALNNYILTKLDGQYVFRSGLSVLGTHGHDIADVGGLQTALDAKAPLANPALTGNPTAPTQSTGNNSTRLANTAFVQGELDILAAAITVGLTGKAPSASPSLTGDIQLDGSARGNKTAFTGGAVDCSLGNYFTSAISANTTLAFSNVPANSYACTLKVNWTGGVITLPAGVKLLNGKALKYVSGVWHFVFSTDDGGTTWELVAGQFA